MLHSAEALPAGDIAKPNITLHAKWFYMSFHSKDPAKYLESGRRLQDENLKSVAK
jgi:hypothetical protein